MTNKWNITAQGLVVAGRRIFITRGQLMLLMVAMNLAFLGLDIWLAHDLDGTIRPHEWIPIIFGPTAAVILLAMGVLSLRHRTAAILLTLVVLAVSLIVGLLGAYFHIDRALPPRGSENTGVVLRWFVYAPPVIAPLTFSLVAVLGVIAAVYEDPPNSGRMVVPGLFHWRIPFTKTQQYLIWIGLGIVATLVSSVLDHGRFNFANHWVWIPNITGVFSAVACITLGLTPNPSRGNYIVHIVSMVALIIVGIIGTILHVDADLTSQGTIVAERFMRGAPFLAPMLFADMGTLGLIALWPIEEKLVTTPHA